MGLYLSIITLNVNELNAPIKRQRLAEWIQKQDPYIYYTTSNQGTHTDWKWRAGKIIFSLFHANTDQKKAGVAIFILDKIDFEIMVMKRDREGLYKMIRGSIQEENITILNIYMHPTWEHCNM